MIILIPNLLLYVFFIYYFNKLKSILLYIYNMSSSNDHYIINNWEDEN